MAHIKSRPNILYITGVRKSDASSLDDIVETRFLRITTPVKRATETKEKISTVPWRPTKNMSSKLPSHYSGPSSWPSKTDLRCMVCGGCCDTLIFCPKNIEIKNDILECDTEGTFNTFACAAWYIRYNKGNDEATKYALAKLYYDFMHKKTHEILPCPNPLLLDIHGGNMPIDVFIAQCVKTNREIEEDDHGESSTTVINTSTNIKELTELFDP